MLGSGICCTTRCTLSGVRAPSPLPCPIAPFRYLSPNVQLTYSHARMCTDTHPFGVWASTAPADRLNTRAASMHRIVPSRACRVPHPCSQQLRRVLCPLLRLSFSSDSCQGCATGLSLAYPYCSSSASGIALAWVTAAAVCGNGTRALCCPPPAGHSVFHERLTPPVVRFESRPQSTSPVHLDRLTPSRTHASGCPNGKHADLSASRRRSLPVHADTTRQPGLWDSLDCGAASSAACDIG